jgi:hypothetical protein
MCFSGVKYTTEFFFDFSDVIVPLDSREAFAKIFLQEESLVTIFGLIGEYQPLAIQNEIISTST